MVILSYAADAPTDPALLAGAALWNLRTDAQESMLKSAVTTIVPKKNRSSGFGIFETSFGIFWFLGSWFSGWLYDLDLNVMIAFCLITQLAAVPFYLLSAHEQARMTAKT